VGSVYTAYVCVPCLSGSYLLDKKHPLDVEDKETLMMARGWILIACHTHSHMVPLYSSMACLSPNPRPSALRWCSRVRQSWTWIRFSLDVSPALNSEWAPRRGLSHQSHVVIYRDTYGQAKVYSKVRLARNVDCPCQLSLCGQVLACTESVTSEYHKSRLYLSVLVRYWGRLARVKVVLEVLR